MNERKADAFLIRLPYINQERTGKKIKQAISASGYTTKQLSQILGVSKNAIYAWYKGDKLPKIDNLICMAYLTGNHVEDFLECTYEICEVFDD